MNFGRGGAHLLHDVFGEWDIAHAVRDLLALAQSIIHELAKILGLLRVLLLVEEHPGEADNRIGLRPGRVFNPGDQVRGQLGICERGCARSIPGRDIVASRILQ